MALEIRISVVVLVDSEEPEMGLAGFAAHYRDRIRASFGRVGEVQSVNVEILQDGKPVAGAGSGRSIVGG